MRRRVHLAVATFAVLSVGGCSDQTPTVPAASNSAKRATLLDATSGGNPHFYFLRPIAPTNPSFSGEFNANLYPTVEVCFGTTQSTTGHCADVLASFTLDGGVNNNGEVLSTPNGEQMYKTQWHTGGYDVPLEQPLRVVVLLGNFVAGYVDVIKGANGKFRDAETGTQISGNSTLPIKFRIEHGVFCGDAPACAEGAVYGDGGDDPIVLQILNSTIAGADFPDGSIDQPVNVIIEEVTQGECLPTDLQQFRGCYHFYTEPAVANFNIPVDVGICVETAGLAYLNNKELKLWKWSEEAGDQMVELETTLVDFLQCEAQSSSSLLGSSSPFVRGLARVGSAAMSPLAHLLAPRKAYAALGYEGGKLGNFSRVGWVRPLAAQIVQGNNQTGGAGTTLPINPTVRVQNRYGPSHQGVAGRAVNFTPSGDGVANPAATTSGSNGNAATAWTLATVAGPNTLLAHVPTSRAVAPAPYETQVTFNATGAVLVTVKWLPPLVSKSSLTGTLAGPVAPVLTIGAVGGDLLAILYPTASNGQYSVNWNVPTLVPGVIYRLALSVGGLQQGEVLLVQVNDELRNVTTGDRVLNLKNSRTLPIKFILYR